MPPPKNPVAHITISKADVGRRILAAAALERIRIKLLGSRAIIISVCVVAISYHLVRGASASEISISPNSTSHHTIVYVNGALTLGDEVRFEAAIKGKSRGTVVFSSPGGNLVAGLRIGNLISQSKFATLILNGSECASACALAWLAGEPRQVQSGGRVGFHAAYLDGPTGKQETGAGNALVGAYLERLRMNEWAIVYLTSAPPEGIQWLTEADGDGQRVGIEFSSLDLQQDPFSERISAGDPRTQKPVIEPKISAPSETKPSQVSLNRSQFEMAFMRHPLGSELKRERPKDFDLFVNTMFDAYKNGASIASVRSRLLSIAQPYIWERLKRADDQVLVEWSDLLLKDYQRSVARNPRLCIATLNGRQRNTLTSLTDGEEARFYKSLFSSQGAIRTAMDADNVKKMTDAIWSKVLSQNRDRILGRLSLYGNDPVKLASSLKDPKTSDEHRLVCDLLLQSERELQSYPVAQRAAVARTLLELYPSR